MADPLPDQSGPVVDEGAADFRACVEGKITSAEYVRRLRLRVGVSRSATRMKAVQDPVGLAHAALDLAAEADRLRADNERLREALTVAREAMGISHTIDPSHGEWKGEGEDIWFDYGDTHTENCGACEVERKIDAALDLAPASDDFEVRGGDEGTGTPPETAHG